MELHFKTIKILCYVYVFTHLQSDLHAALYHSLRLSLVAQLVKNPPAIQETWVQSLVWEDPLEKGKATHSSILAWRTMVTKSRTQLSHFDFHFLYRSKDFQGGCGKESSCQCWRLGLDPWVRKIPWRKKQQPIPVFLPGISRGQGSLADYWEPCVHGVAVRQDLTTEHTELLWNFGVCVCVFPLFLIYF